MTDYPCDSCTNKKRCTQQQHDECPEIEDWLDQCYDDYVKEMK